MILFRLLSFFVLFITWFYFGFEYNHYIDVRIRSIVYILTEFVRCFITETTFAMRRMIRVAHTRFSGFRLRIAVFWIQKERRGGGDDASFILRFVLLASSGWTFGDIRLSPIADFICGMRFPFARVCVSKYLDWVFRRM